MKVETDLYRQFALALQNMDTYGIPFKKQDQMNRHIEIVNGIRRLSHFFEQSAGLYENLEQQNKTNSTLGPIPVSKDFSWVPSSQQSSHHLYKTFDGALSRKTYTYNNDYLNASLNVNLGSVRAEGEIEYSVWKNGKIDPSLEINAVATMSVLDFTGYVDVGNTYLHNQTRAEVRVGTVYADAQVILSMEEQTVDLGVGASAIKGEVESSFDVFGIRITLTGTGSVGSAEANITYHHKNREWEFGSKLGFIVGLGYKVRVEY